ICLADMPFIRTETYKAIASRVTATNIVIPKFNGIAGNPIAFGKDHFQVLNELKGDEGARKVLKNHQNLILEVETNDPGVLYDIDTPNDLLNAERRFAGLE
ncbi:MAG: NTP transferase domain-containing protein, partial [Gammaproteobacteria bacterium]|nr:NTP transferase domain-containing protein [Gammaproteobacteria bacterium]